LYFKIDNVVKIYFTEYVRAFSPDKKLTIIEGDFVEVEGIVDEYYNDPEVKPASLYDINIKNDGGS